MKKEETAPNTFQLQLEDCVRVHNECMSGLASLIHDKVIMVEGRECKVSVIKSDGELLAHILNPAGNLLFMEFRAVYSGRHG